MKKVKKAVFLILLLIIAVFAFGLKTYHDAGEFKTLDFHFDGESRVVGGLLSSEDITIDYASGRAFISSADRRSRWSGKAPQNGDVFVYDLGALESGQATPLNLNLQLSHKFNPHGIDVFRNEAGELTLLAVNHNENGHFIEIFREQDSLFVHEASIRDSLMHSPNDVVAVDENRFYVTNDHGNVTALGKTFEDYLQLNRSYLLYYDGVRFRKVAEGFAYANGVNISRDGKSVYVAATVDGEISVFDRDLKNGDLRLIEKIDLKTGVDNIEVDENGNLWIGAHPQMLTFIAHSKDANALSPSQVFRLERNANGEFSAAEIYLEKGEMLSGSSVAVVYGETLLIGAVFDPKFLVCKMR